MNEQLQKEGLKTTIEMSNEIFTTEDPQVFAKHLIEQIDRFSLEDQNQIFAYVFSNIIDQRQKQVQDLIQTSEEIKRSCATLMSITQSKVN